jgi:hypothetical protein
MPEQTPINRVSLKKSLVDRYNTEQVGGAFDVKAQLAIKDHTPIIDSLQSAKWTPAGFKVKQQLMVTEFKDTTLNFTDTTGFSNKKYKP